MKQDNSILLITCLIISFGLNSLIYQSPKVAPRFLSLETIKPATCPPTLHFQVGYQRDIGGAVVKGQSVNFTGFSYVEAKICSAGTLIIDAEGQLGGPDLPHLDVGLNNDSLGGSDFNTRKTVRFIIPHAGRLTLGYFNDYYLADVRVATLSQFRLTSAPCNTLSFEVPAATGGSYDVKTNVVTLVAAVPMTIQPCKAGQLHFLSTGRAGQNVFPQLRIAQGGKLLAQIQTSATHQMTQLNVTAEPISIMVINPYGKQLADRNLILHSVKFIPASSTATP